MVEVTLTVQSLDGTRIVPLTGERLTIGRGEGADVRIDDSGLSLLHASICRDGDKVWMLDESSTNGSLVNGAAVGTAGVALADGDKISVGDYTTIWVRVTRPASDDGLRTPTRVRFPTAAAALVSIAVVIGVIALASHFFKGESRTSSGGKASRAAGNKSDRVSVLVENSNASGTAGDTAEAEGDWNSPADGSSRSARLYKRMTEAERLEFLYDRARHVSRMMGNREYQFTDDILPMIKRYVDGYAQRVGNGSNRIWGEDLNLLFGRARRVAPHIIRSFNSNGVPSVVGLYLPMIESEYRECLESPVGAKGLFQFMPDTARGYGVDPGDRCNVEKMAPAAARYMKDRIAEFGTDAMSVALGIAGYNRSPDSVRRDLHDVLNSENKERSFWTLVANSDKLDRFFQNENVKYVPKFFAAAIVGETPWAFGLQMNPLSTYTSDGA